jgi:hypothetical protein
MSLPVSTRHRRAYFYEWLRRAAPSHMRRNLLVLPFAAERHKEARSESDDVARADLISTTLGSPYHCGRSTSLVIEFH